MSNQTYTFNCPSCDEHIVYGTPYCPHCGLKSTGPDVARLVDIRAQFRRLQVEWTEVMERLRATQQREHDEAVQSAATVPPAAPAVTPTLPQKEWTAKRVQNTLLGVGALLCTAAALLFVVFAWNRLGLGGRALVMGATTAAFFVGGAFAFRRQLRSTAESLTFVALCMTLIDIGAAYALDVMNLRSIPATLYWASALGVMALAGVAYRAAVRIDVTGIFAVIAAQIPAGLVLINVHATPAATAFVLGAQAIALLVVLPALRDERFLGEIVQVGALLAWVVAGIVVLVHSLSFTATSDVAANILAIGLMATSALGIGVVGKSLVARWREYWTTAAVVTTSYGVWIVAERMFAGNATACVLAASGLSLVLVLRRFDEHNVSARTVGALLTGMGVLAETQAIVAAIASPVFVATIWHVDGSRTANALVPFDLRSTADVISVATLLVAAGTALVFNRTATRQLASVSVAGALIAAATYLAWLITPVPYIFFVTLLVLISTATTFGAHAVSKNPAVKLTLAGIGVAFWIESLAWSFLHGSMNVLVLGAAAVAAVVFARVDVKRVQSSTIIATALLLSFTLAAALRFHNPLDRSAWIVLAVSCAMSVAATYRVRHVALGVASVSVVSGVLATFASFDDQGWTTWAFATIAVTFGVATLEKSQRGLVNFTSGASLIWLVSFAALHGMESSATAVLLVTVSGAIAIAVDRTMHRFGDSALLVNGAAVLAALSMAAGDPVRLAVVFLIAAGVLAIVATADGRRPLGWVSSALAIASLWVRLNMDHVVVFEAYSVPVALVVLFAGYRALRANRNLSSWSAYGAGLGTAFGPSIMLMSSTESMVRPTFVAMAALLAIAYGSANRYKAPLAAGSLVLCIEALQQFGPYLNHVPRWTLVGIAGVVLIGVGTTYERRLQEARRVRAAYDSLQ